MPFSSNRQSFLLSIATLVLALAFLATPCRAKSLAQTHSAYVPMRDEVRLAIDVHLPIQEGGPSCFPVLLEYTPYQRSTIDPKTGVVSDVTGSARGRFFLSHGYALVRADMRGTGASEGFMMDFMPQLAEDGKDLVDWIGKQEWCNGHVGMMGGSYLGWSQTATASQCPSALHCIAPAVIPLDGYSGEVYPGGIYLKGFMEGFSQWMALITRNVLKPTKPTKPVVDEDQDGEWLDEIPLDTDGDGSFLDEEKAAYSDGEKREGVYLSATRQHEKNYDYNAWASKVRFLDGPSSMGIDLYQLSPSAHIPGIAQSGIPVFHIGGWFDGFTRGSFELHCTLSQTNPSWLLICPSYHGPTEGPYWAYLGETPKKAEKMLHENLLRFFDRYLKGTMNGWDEEAPIRTYVMHGEGWRESQAWPPPESQETAFYLDTSFHLSEAPGNAGKDPYQPDLAHSSTYGKNHGNRWLGIGGQWPKSVPERTDKAKQCAVYTGKPLTKDTEVTGHPLLHLFVSCSAADGDFFFYLEDVEPEGRSLLVTEGQLRAGFASLKNNDKMILQGRHNIDVKPELPWHGFEKKDYNPEIFSDGAIVELTVDLFPTSWVFRKGHAIRLSIACADRPTFPLHPLWDPKNPPTVHIHRGKKHPSRLLLPVAP